jgi:copper(I)-binding protein
LVKRLGALAAFAVALIAASCSGHEPHPDLTFSDAQIRPIAGTSSAVLSVQIENAGGTEQLLSVDVPEADGATLHLVQQSDDEAEMVVTDSIQIPAGGFALDAEGAHVRLEGLDPRLQEGDTVNVTFELARARDRELEIPVVTSVP